MTKDVLVNIKGIQTVFGSPGEPEEPIELLTAGTYRKEDGRHILEYDEVFEDIAGGTTKNTVIIEGSSVEVIKSGQTDVDMFFEEGKMNVSYYTTPFGTIEMGIATTGLKVSEEDERLTVKAEYALSMNAQHVADCSLDIVAESKK